MTSRARKQPFSAGAAISLRLDAPDLAVQVQARGIVRRQTALSAHTFGCAVELVGLGAKERATLAAYVEESLFKPLHLALRLGATREDQP